MTDPSTPAEQPAAPRPAWLDDFTVPAHPAGAVLALDFGADGLWAARLADDGRLAATATEPRITGRVLDLRMAGFLRTTGAVPEADRPEVFTELVDLVRRARDGLADRDSVLLMGTEHLRLVTVSLDTVLEATVPEINRVHGMVVELAGREPVAAILLGPGTDAWPGLWEALTERGYSLLLPGDDFPALFAGDEEPTGALDAVDQEQAALAWSASETIPPVGDDPGARRRNRVAAAVGVVACLAILGGAVAVAVTSTRPADDDSGPIAVATPSADDDEVSGTETTSAGAPSTALPADIAAARAEMSRYRPPTSTPTQTSQPRQPTQTATEAPTGANPRPRPRPNPRRTIPNPIPGLPPIVIG